MLPIFNQLTEERNITMKNSRNIIKFTLAVLFLFAANTQADIVQIGAVKFTTDRTDYLGGVHGTDWGFTSVGQHTGSNNPSWTQWTFNIKDSDGVAKTGAIYSDTFNGNGGNGSGMGAMTVNPDLGTGSMSHNSANNFQISFTDPFATSFYIALNPWSSYSAATAFDLTVKYWDADGKLYTQNRNATFTDSTPFLGFNLEEGFFLASVSVGSIGTKNNGYNIVGMGFGDNGFNNIYPGITVPEPSPTPEPATLAVLGLGLAGLGIARRRMKK